MARLGGMKCGEVWGVHVRKGEEGVRLPSPPKHAPAIARNASCRVYVALAFVSERMFIATIMATRPDRGESEPCVMGEEV